jgi:hypothetical protein
MRTLGSVALGLMQGGARHACQAPLSAPCRRGRNVARVLPRQIGFGAFSQQFAKGKRSKYVSDGGPNASFMDNILTSFIGMFIRRSQTGS